MDFRKHISSLEFQFFAYGINPNVLRTDYENQEYYYFGQNRTVYHSRGLPNMEGLPSMAVLKRKYKKYGWFLFMRHWFKADYPGYDWPELERERYCNRWHAWWLWDVPELRELIRGPRVIQVKKSIFGLPTLFRTQPEISEKDEIWYESQYSYLKRTGCFWEAEKNYRKQKEIEQIWPVKKLL
jgi:hypothetical protein